MAIRSTYVDLEITVCGVTREVQADVKYIHTRAFRGIFETGGGQISPDEPETAEIQSVCVTECQTDSMGGIINHEMLYLLTDAQIDAISTEVLEQGG